MNQIESNTINPNNGNDDQCPPQISQSSKVKADVFRAYIEKKYSKKKIEDKEKKENWEMLQKKMEDLNISTAEREQIKREILHKEAQQLRNKRKRISAKDFEPITIIGRGAFGEVRVCKWKDTNEIVAMKKINKNEMLNKNQISHIRAERDVLATAQNPWIVELKCSFQDERYLYLVMEYLAGGDLMTLLMKKDILSENESKFYIAEAILAVESVHKLNYIHRDLKPDNILLDSKGHIKLSDFGLCKHTEIRPRKFQFKKNDEPEPDPILTKSNLAKKPNGFKRNRQLAFTTVGTPDYIAPEVFGEKGYTETVDWWSLGVILFEMLIGYPPFYSEDPSSTCQNILNWRKTLVIPHDANISPQAVDILRKLIADPNERLGVNGVEEIKAHPFFIGIDWKNIRSKKAPNIPELKSDIDTSNFDKFEEEEPWYIEDDTKPKKYRKDANFIGYTFKRDIEAQRSLLVAALQELEANKSSQARPKIGHGNQNLKNEEGNARGLSPNYAHKTSNQNLNAISQSPNTHYSNMKSEAPRAELNYPNSKIDHNKMDQTYSKVGRLYQANQNLYNQETSSSGTKSPSSVNPAKKTAMSHFKENMCKTGSIINPRLEASGVFANNIDQNLRKKETHIGMFSPDLNYTKGGMPKYSIQTNQSNSSQYTNFNSKVLNVNSNYNNINKNVGMVDLAGTTTTYGVSNMKYAGVSSNISGTSIGKSGFRQNKE